MKYLVKYMVCFWTYIIAISEILGHKDPTWQTFLIAIMFMIPIVYGDMLHEIEKENK